MDFIGNQKIIKILERSLKNGKVSQAYLFYGPEQVGKFTLAKMFAKCLIKGTTSLFSNLKEDEINLPDLVVIEPEREEKHENIKIKDIKIEQIRQAQDWLATFPYSGKFKVLVINEVERMTLTAQNSLLKILEEPNSTSIIILVTGNTKNILPTIQSRCQKLNFSLVEDNEITKMFSGTSIWKGKKISEWSQGRPGLAVKIKQGWLEPKVLNLIEKIKFIEKMSINEKFDLAEELSKDADLAGKIFDFWIWNLRNRAIQFDSQRVNYYYKIEKIEKIHLLIKETNANARLALENLLLSFE